MTLLFQQIRRDPLLWLLVFVPGLFAAAKLAPGAHTLLFAVGRLLLMAYLIFAMTLYLLPPRAA